jgi:hypothetical protein
LYIFENILSKVTDCELNNIQKAKKCGCNNDDKKISNIKREQEKNTDCFWNTQHRELAINNVQRHSVARWISTR